MQLHHRATSPPWLLIHIHAILRVPCNEANVCLSPPVSGIFQVLVAIMKLTDGQDEAERSTSLHPHVATHFGSVLATLNSASLGELTRKLDPKLPSVMIPANDSAHFEFSLKNITFVLNRIHCVFQCVFVSGCILLAFCVSLRQHLVLNQNFRKKGRDRASTYTKNPKSQHGSQRLIW